VSDWQLRYGHGGTDLREIPAPPPQWVAFLWIGFGALHLFVPRFAGRMEPPLLIIMGGFFLGIAVLGLLTEPWFEARRIRRYEARLETIAQRAGPQSEEMRAALSNRPRMTNRRRQLLVGLLFILFGGAFLALGLSMPR
jgi:protein-S-isoprenylcysteine O-methyltransferase Ste14